MKLIRVTLFTFLCACITFIPLGLNSAEAELAAMTANGAAPQSLNTASFVVYATNSTSGANPNGAPLTLSYTRDAQYFYVRNTGTVDITGFSLAVTYSVTPARTEFYRCEVGVVFSALNTCASGIRTTIATNSGLVTIPIPLPPNSWVAFELDPKKLTTPTVNVSVSSSQIRPGITTNS